MNAPDQIERTVRQYTADVVLTYQKFKTGKLTKNEALDSMAKRLNDLQKAAGAASEENITGQLLKLGIETLHTDQQGRRSAEWFRTTGLKFATGLATTCVVCAVTHPDVGMGAAHFNSITPTSIRNYLLDKLDNFEFYSREFLSPNSQQHYLLAQSNLPFVVDKAVGAATSEFAALGSPDVAKGIGVYIGGLDYLSPEKVEECNRAAISAIKTNQILKRGMPIKFNGMFGSQTGFMFNGADRPEAYSY